MTCRRWYAEVGRSENRPLLMLLLAWLLVLLLLFRPRVYVYDPVGYYSWLRSVVIQGSLDVSDAFTHYGLTERGLSPTGYRLNEWPIGSAILWAPFYLVAHGVTLAGQALGLPWAADGYSAPYLVITGLGSAIYAFLGLYWLYALGRELAPPRPALWAVLTAWLASPLVFYMAGHPFMAHANDFMLNALFLYLWVRHPHVTWRSHLVLGLVGGLAACVRPQNATLLLWPGLELGVGIIRAGSWRPQRDLAGPPTSTQHSGWWGKVAGLLALVAGAIVGFLPQMIVWRVAFGNWLVLNAYGAVGAGSFDWRAPHLLDVLFSTNRGLFLWIPMALLAVYGLARHLLRLRRRWALFLLANLLAQVYIVGSWSSWSGAAAFGQRLLVNSVPAWGLGLAALYAAWAGPGRAASLADDGHNLRLASRPQALARRAAVPLISLLLIGWNLLLLLRYALQDVPRIGAVALDQLWLGQFRF